MALVGVYVNPCLLAVVILRVDSFEFDGWMGDDFTSFSTVFSHLGMFVTTGCSSRRQFVATASRQDTGSRQQNIDSGRQVTASGQFFKPSQTQESKYSSYALLLLCRLKWKNGSTFNERNFM